MQIVRLSYFTGYCIYKMNLIVILKSVNILVIKSGYNVTNIVENQETLFGQYI